MKCLYSSRFLKSLYATVLGLYEQRLTHLESAEATALEERVRYKVDLERAR